MSHPLFEQHAKTLEAAVAAIRARTYYSAYPEIPSGKIYGETAKADGLAAFQARLGKPWAVEHPGAVGSIGAEVSPFTGKTLGVTYPRVALDALIADVTTARGPWGRAEVETRLGICLEMLSRLNAASYEISNAVMHTTGQGFMMAFQAGGPHAQDRGLEALAYAWEAMSATPAAVTWEKKVSKTDVVRLQKRFHIVPRGIGVVIGCSTFPTWNSYPGLFASLATGNAVIIKPHPGAVLPLAITAEICRALLAEQGFDPNIVTLAADMPDAPVTKELVTRPKVGIVDYTGSSEFGSWVEEHARQAHVYTEKAGVNSIVIDSTDDLKLMTGNIAFTLSLYSGQMCTSSQNLFIPEEGIDIGGERKSFDEVAGAIVKAIDWLLGEPARGAEILGAIQSERTIERIEAAAAAGGTVLRESTRVPNEAFPDARVRSPLLVKVDASQTDLFMAERFGPIVYLVQTTDTDQSIELAARAARALGAITGAVYSTSDDVLRMAEEAAIDSGVALSCNLMGQVYVNQSAAFSDYHVSGANPAGNATLCDAAYVANRFRVVQNRVQVPVEAEAHAGI